MSDDGQRRSFAAIEREHLVEALRAAGPDAPTLCEGWTAHDLAAHLVARERRLDSGPGIMFAPLAGWTERVRRGYLRRPFDELLRLYAGGPPLGSVFALPGVDAAANLTEHFVHCEDVRRAAPQWEPRDLDPGLPPALWSLLRKRGRMLFRAGASDLTLATPGGERAVLGGEGVLLTGEPAELMLYAFGRTAHARVSVTGDPAAIERFRAVRLGI